ncbi:MAG: hypothetical protein HQL30_08945 [Candidatus Omnitrophica bacterium]|nr:hypothetical protein [Candidatus Omnitrophota bacterium]
MPDSSIKNILANIDLAKRNIRENRNIRDVVLVLGNEKDRNYWEKRLALTSCNVFNADGKTRITALEEKLGEKTRQGNFLGTLLAYSRHKDIQNPNPNHEPRLSSVALAKEGTTPVLRSFSEGGNHDLNKVILMGMLFGKGERISPFSQIECGCKSAIASVSIPDKEKIGYRMLSEIEEALMYFSPVAKYLEEGGFEGILNKWGDETEIPSIDLAQGASLEGKYAAYDIVKFISRVRVTGSLAANKDWVAYDSNNTLITQIARADKNELIRRLEQSGIERSDDGEYYAGVSLGPVALSYRFLDVALEVFSEDMDKTGVFYDFDPYLIMAFALGADNKKWERMVSDDPKLNALAGPRGMVPDLYDKVRKTAAVFRERHGRELTVRVIDLGDNVFWTDIGQHDRMREKYLALTEDTEFGKIARKIEGLDDKRDENGNIVVNSEISPDMAVRDSVVINSRLLGKGSIRSSVIKDSLLNNSEMFRAFSVLCHRTGNTVLKENSGIYRSLGCSLDGLLLEPGMRHGTLLSPRGPIDMSVSETSDLRDKEKNYDNPVFGNPISFGEAYDLMKGSEYSDIQERKIAMLIKTGRIDEMKNITVELSFGTSGLRDTVLNMTDMECYINAMGFIAYLEMKGEFTAGTVVALGADRRPSSPRIKRAVAAAVRDRGGVVDDQGLTPSPALAFYAASKKIPSVMVTGSHIPADRNGIKFTKPEGEVLKSDEKGILENVLSERKKVYSQDPERSMFDGSGMFKEGPALEAGLLLGAQDAGGEANGMYVERYSGLFGSDFFPKGAKIFLYEHSAVGRDIVKEIFTRIGVEVYAPDVSVDIEYSGIKEKAFLRSSEFVPVDTESVSARTMAVFKKVMLDKGIDIGISLDGDSDRPLLAYRVYKEGKPLAEVSYVTGDILGLLSVLGLESLGVKIDAVCCPVSANDAIAQVLSPKGLEITETKIGSPYVIAAMNDSIKANSSGKSGSWAVCSWESNGGFLTGTDLTIRGKILKALPTRDAVLPLISVIHSAYREGTGISGLLKGLPPRFTYADRRKEFPTAKSKAIIGKISPSGERNIRQAVFMGDRGVILENWNGQKSGVDKDGELLAIKQLLEKAYAGFPEIKSLNYTDGVRVIFGNGEISHLRPSGNAPEFRNYAIADSPERAREIVRLGLEKVIPRLLELCEVQSA